MPTAKAPAASALEKLRAFALGYPEAREEFPWGERVVKVRKKIFVFLGRSVTLAVKLPEAGVAALALPFAEPTGYGLGKSGWVTLTFAARDRRPVELLRQFIDESYQAVAPKRLVKELAAANARAPGR